MPRIVKGGKWIYSCVIIDKKRSIQIPAEACKDYGFRPSDKIVATQGSRRSGGFGLTKKRLIKGTPLSRILNGQHQIFGFSMDRNGQIQLQLGFLKNQGLKPGDKLLLVRGSRYVLGFVSKGPIFREALKHPDLPTLII